MAPRTKGSACLTPRMRPGDSGSSIHSGSDILVELFCLEGKLMTLPAFPFTTLTEESTNTTMTLPAGFDAMTAWLLAQCCELTYLQYDMATPPDLSSLILTGATLTPGTPQLLTVSEANGPESSPNFPGSYTTQSVGFV